MRKLESFMVCIFLFAALPACGGDDDGDGGGDDGGDDDGGVASFISEVQTADGTVTAEAGAPPDEGDGPLATVISSGTVINGGTVMVQIESDEMFDRVVVAIDGAEGFFEVSLPEAVAFLDLLITLSQNIGESEFAFLYAVGSEAGIGTYEAVEATVVSVGTGEVQVSVSWDAASDVDLHVVDPDGEEIYWAMTTSLSGGELDLDSNAGCSIDNVNNENITWEVAPEGTYAVRLDYYLACSVEETNYVVTVQRVDHDAETFSGTFTGGGDSGGAGDGIDITTFDMP